MLHKFATAGAAIVFAAVVPAVVTAQVTIGTPVVPSQTVLTGTLEHPINTKTAQPTDQFVLDIQPPYPGDDQRLNGARVIGHIAAADPAQGFKKGQVTLAFDRLMFADGTEATVTGQMISSQGQQGGNTAVRAVTGAVIGNVLGNWLGKSVGSNVGGAVGLLGGAAIGAKLATNTTLPQGSTVQFKTTQASLVTGRRQAGADYQTPAVQGPPPSYSQPAAQPPPTYAQPVSPPAHSQPPPAQPYPQPSPTI